MDFGLLFSPSWPTCWIHGHTLCWMLRQYLPLYLFPRTRFSHLVLVAEGGRLPLLHRFFLDCLDGLSFIALLGFFLAFWLEMDGLGDGLDYGLWRFWVSRELGWAFWIPLEYLVGNHTHFLYSFRVTLPFRSSPLLYSFLIDTLLVIPFSFIPLLFRVVISSFLFSTPACCVLDRHVLCCFSECLYHHLLQILRLLLHWSCFSTVFLARFTHIHMSPFSFAFFTSWDRFSFWLCFHSVSLVISYGFRLLAFARAHIPLSLPTHDTISYATLSLLHLYAYGALLHTLEHLLSSNIWLALRYSTEKVDWCMKVRTLYYHIRREGTLKMIGKIESSNVANSSTPHPLLGGTFPLAQILSHTHTTRHDFIIRWIFHIL